MRNLENLIRALSRDAEEEGFEYGVRLEVGYSYAWSCEVRITPHSTIDGKPDRSLTTFSAGGSSARDAAEKAIVDALIYFHETLRQELEAERDTLRSQIAQLAPPVLQ